MRAAGELCDKWRSGRGARGGSPGIIIIQPAAFVTPKPNCYPLLVTTLKCWPFKCCLISLGTGSQTGSFVVGFTSSQLRRVLF